MNASLGKTLVFFGTLGSLALSVFRFFSSALNVNLLTVFNILSFVSTLVMAVGFFLSFREDTDIIWLIIGVLVLGSYPVSFIYPSLPGSVMSLIFIVLNTHLLLWAFKLKDKNLPVALLLGILFLWPIFGVSILARFINLTTYTTVYLMINVITATVPVIAAFVDMKD